MSRMRARTKLGAGATASPKVDETLPTTSFISRTAGQSCCMTKLLLDNRVVAGLFFLLVLVNAFAIQNGWY